MKKSLAEQYAETALQDRIWTGRDLTYAYAIGIFTGCMISFLIMCHFILR